MRTFEKVATRERLLHIYVSCERHNPRHYSHEPLYKHNVFSTVSIQRSDMSRPFLAGAIHFCDKIRRAYRTAVPPTGRSVKVSASFCFDYPFLAVGSRPPPQPFQSIAEDHGARSGEFKNWLNITASFLLPVSFRG